MVEKTFVIGDLVWAKIKGYCHWPARIEAPPGGNEKKNKYYVTFFGTNDSSWVAFNAVIPHSKSQVDKCLHKKIPFLKEAIAEIIKQSSHSKKDEALLDDSNENEKSPQSDGSSDIKNFAGTVTNSSHPASTVKTSKRKNVKRQNAVTKKKRKSAASLVDAKIRMENALKLASEDVEDGSANSESSDSSTNETEDEEARKLIPTDKKIGFLTVGNMGRLLLDNILSTGHNVTVVDETLDERGMYAAMNAAVVRTPADLVKSCDLLFSCVSGPEKAEALLDGKDGVLAGLEDCQGGNKGYIELSTIDPKTSMRINKRLEEKLCRYLEAPICGSKDEAETGELLILAAGDCRLFSECDSCFHSVSTNIYFLGSEIGLASRTNLVSGMLLGVGVTALGECFAVLDKLGLSRKVFLELLMLEDDDQKVTDKGAVMVSQTFQPVHTLKHQLKNLFMAWTLGDITNQQTPTIAAAVELYNHANLLNYAEHDVSAVYWAAKY